MGDTVYLRAEIVRPRDKKNHTIAIISNFTELFELQDSTFDEVQVITGKNHIVKIPVSFRKRGWNTFRAVIEDHELEMEKDKKHYLSNVRPYYIFYDFYVE